MNQAVVDKIVQAVLYEGYNLYPYRPSVKNRCRWTFGGLYPRSYSDAGGGTDAWNMQMQCLVAIALRGDQVIQIAAEGDRYRGNDAEVGQCTVEINLRFLHLLQRTIGVLKEPCDELPTGQDPAYQAVDSLLLKGTHYQSWQEAVEREVAIGPIELATHTSPASVHSFTVPASHTLEPLRGPDGRIAAVAVRDQQGLEGAAEIATERIEESIYRLTVRVFNRTPLENAGTLSRDEASLRSLAALHAVVVAYGGKFYSLTDPPEALRDVAAACRNVGVWPVLVGCPGEQDAMLASPIILYDYPQMAPESPGDLFDGTEIDEILTLRIMTLTDEEKAMAAGIDDRTRRLIERTESLAHEQLAGLHGTVRALEPLAEVKIGGWDPFASQAAIESILVDDIPLRPGDHVRLRPGLGGDIFDLALNGKTATIESIEQDFEDQFHVAVTLDDDPGQDLGRARQPGHRFFFKPDEIAPLDCSERPPWRSMTTVSTDETERHGGRSLQ